MAEWTKWYPNIEVRGYSIGIQYRGDGRTRPNFFSIKKAAKNVAIIGIGAVLGYGAYEINKKRR